MKKINSSLNFIYSILIIFTLNNSGIAQWQWIWPLPQGVNLNSVTLLDENIGLYAGDYGIILKTTNSGLNYTPINVGYGINLNACKFIDENLCFAGGNFSRIFKSSNSGLNWSYTSIESNYGIIDFSFANNLTGWALARFNDIYKTTNSGLSWVHSSLPIINSVYSIYFVNSLTGFAGGEVGRAKLIKTTDGGLTWFRTDYYYHNKINSIYFTDSLIGYLGCSDSKIYKTTNGGNDWLPNSDSLLTGNIKSVKFLNKFGVAIMDKGDLQVIYRSTDSGETWDEVYYDSLVKFTSIDFKKQKVVVTGTSGRIIMSDDQGISWTSNKANILSGFSYIKFTDENTGIAAGGGYPGKPFRTYRTTNGGQDWIIYSNSPNVSNVSKTYFVNLNTGYLVGGNSNLLGKVYKTTNFGTNWLELPPPLNKVMYDVEFINEQTGIVCGMEGMLAKTTNGALSWSVTNSGGPHLNSDMDFVDPENCYSGSSGGDIYKSTNGGNTWFVSGNVIHSISDISFVNAQTGYVATGNGVYKTTDGGYNWQIISGNGSFHSVSFFDVNTGYVASYNGRIYRTTTGGTSWSDQTYISPALEYYTYEFISSEIVYMIGSSMLFKTTNGGVLTNLTNNSINLNKSYLLAQNFPNPFNPSTTINYQIPEDQFVSIKVYDILGKQIRILQDNFVTAGSHEIKFDAGNLPGGIYIYKIETPDYFESKKMILLK